MRVRKAIVLGRRDHGTNIVVILRVANGALLAPWTVKAIVSRN